MNASLQELDVRPLPPAQRHPLIFRTFDALPPGKGLVLINDHDPKPLLYQFQFERPHGFEWSVLEAGPNDFRVEIRRRAAEGPRNVTEYLSNDHRRLDAIAETVEGFVSKDDFSEAGRRFGEFSCGLNRHIDMEECILFPVFERATGLVSGGPTVVMRAEHVQIRRAMEAIQAAIAAKSKKDFAAGMGQLRDALVPHNMKEEQILYPSTDRACGGDHERDQLVKRMQAI
ncbi:MAG: DUF2249 domain-containing protein [Bdellovibrionota bacterium]